MASSTEIWEGDDDLARQRRKRDARLLDEHLVDYPALTIADVVAEVLAAAGSDGADGPLDVRRYLMAEGHHWRTIEAVVAFMQRYDAPDGQALDGHGPAPHPPTGLAGHPGHPGHPGHAGHPGHGLPGQSPTQLRLL